MSTKSKATRRPKENRKPLASLQVHRSDASILVGGSGKSLGKKTKKMLKEFKKDSILTQVETSEKGTQTDEDLPHYRTDSIDYQLCCSDPPPSVYWEVLAEKRRVALKDMIEENERLLTEIEALRAQIKEGERQHNDAMYFHLMYRTVTKENL